MPSENTLCCSWYKEFLEGWASQPTRCQRTPRYYIKIDNHLFVYCETCYSNAFSNMLQVLNPPNMEHGPIHEGIDLEEVYNDPFLPNPYRLHESDAWASDITWEANWSNTDVSDSFVFDMGSLSYE